MFNIGYYPAPEIDEEKSSLIIQNTSVDYQSKNNK